MKPLLNELDANAGKTAYQSYTIKHGIERIKVLIPFKSASLFEEEFNAVTDKTKAALLAVVARHAGKTRGA